ncbi:hypothetical protein VC83_09593 [Pseudogymnoascus destructans]|uniref:Uncharacterized protein n=1 Tax=Pseudogymnoascus destructans TaxID=655981 RepID=A0A2P6FGF7_9PEZI|nr:uncharacterized protein VC83_09593 [Pseudogymnoascus destructans]PQM43466.1 hypothetical protein VC83_09593 [Pseudogymnoascus destructans]
MKGTFLSVPNKALLFNNLIRASASLVTLPLKPPPKAWKAARSGRITELSSTNLRHHLPHSRQRRFLTLLTLILQLGILLLKFRNLDYPIALVLCDFLRCAAARFGFLADAVVLPTDGRDEG